MTLRLLKNPAVRRAIYGLMEKYENSDSYSMATLTNDYITKEIMISGWYEKPFLALLNLLIGNSDINSDVAYVVDVGANIGNHSLYLSRIVDHVVSVEPNPVCVHLMNASIAINNVKNITVVEKGAGSLTGTASLSFDAKHTGGGTFLDIEPDTDARRVLVNIDTLDNISNECVPKNASIKLLKIDAEGFEVEVLRGAQALLKLHSPIVAFEAHGLENYLSISEALKSEGYCAFYKLTQARRMYDSFLLNALNMLVRPSGLNIEQVVDPRDGNYQMVIAVKESGCGKLDELGGFFRG